MRTRTGEIGPGVALLAAALLLASCGTEVARKDARAVIWHAGPPLPAPVTNNAVAAVDLDGSIVVFSFLGLDASKTWSGVTNAANRWDVGTDSWTPIDPVPGLGRLASTAQVVAGPIYVIGGYDGVPSQPIRQVLSYAPLTGEWRQLAAPPIASMDHRNLGEAGGSVFLVGGMHEDQVVTDNVWYTTVSALLTRVF